MLTFLCHTHYLFFVTVAVSPYYTLSLFVPFYQFFFYSLHCSSHQVSLAMSVFLWCSLYLTLYSFSFLVLCLHSLNYNYIVADRYFFVKTLLIIATLFPIQVMLTYCKILMLYYYFIEKPICSPYWNKSRFFTSQLQSLSK